MPLIDHTFFIGEINIPNTDKPEVIEELNRFILKYEEELLTSLLGYEMYKAFKAGLIVDPIEQKWIDLLTGCDFTYLNRLAKWPGLIEGGTLTGSYSNGYSFKPDALVQFAVTPGFIAGESTVTVDGTGGKPDWRGYEVKVEKIGFGTQKRGIDYAWDKTTGIWSLLIDGNTFQANEYYVVSFVPAEDTTLVVGSSSKSLIANYVYFWFIRNSMSSTSGVGETESKTDNSKRVNSANKTRRAWNEMSDKVVMLRSFLQSNTDAYSMFDNSINVNNFSLYRYVTAL